MADRQTRPPTPEEQIEYLQGQIAGLGSMMVAVMRQTKLSPADLQVIGEGLTHPDATFGTTEKNSPAFQAGFKDISKFVGGVLLGDQS